MTRLESVDDDEKTREQLINEVKALRRMVADQGVEGEAQKEKAAGSGTSRTQRNAIRTPITFIGNFSLVQAQGIDLSEGGGLLRSGRRPPF